MIPPRATEGESSNRALGGRRILARASPAAAHRSRAHDRIAEAARYCYYNTLNKRRPMYPADSDRRSPPPLDPADILKSLSHGYTHPVCIFMPRARAIVRVSGRLRLCSYLHLAGIGAYRCRDNARERSGRGGRRREIREADESEREREREGQREARFLRGCIDLRPAGRPTARRRTNRDGFRAGQLAFVLVRLFGYAACPGSVSPRRRGRGRGGGRAGGRRERRPTTPARFELFLAVV